MCHNEDNRVDSQVLGKAVYLNVCWYKRNQDLVLYSQSL